MKTKKNILVFSKSSSHGQHCVSTVLTSFEAVCDFMLDGLAFRDRKTLSYELGPLFNTEFTKFVKNNASIILESLDSPLKNLVSVINNKLTRLVAKSEVTNWTHSGKEIQDLLMNKQLYYNLLLDKVLESHISEIRSIFEDPKKSWQNLEVVELTTSNTNTMSEKIGKNDSDVQNEKEHHNAASKDDDWNWEVEDDDADAWGDEIDVNIDDEEEKTNQEKEKRTRRRRKCLG